MTNKVAKARYVSCLSKFSGDFAHVNGQNSGSVLSFPSLSCTKASIVFGNVLSTCSALTPAPNKIIYQLRKILQLDYFMSDRVNFDAISIWGHYLCYSSGHRMWFNIKTFLSNFYKIYQVFLNGKEICFGISFSHKQNLCMWLMMW